MIHIQSLNYAVKSRTIIKDLNLFVDKGEFVSIIGANGAGKSSLLKLIAGEWKPDSGELRMRGESLHSLSMKEMAKFRGYLHQSNSMDIPFTVEEIVAMGRYQHRATGLDEAIVAECMTLCSLDHLRTRSIRELSGGGQQRVHFARVLAQLWDVEGGVLLLDEPISNMDIQYQHQTLAIAKSLCKIGFTVIAVLHDLNLVAQYSDRVLMMKSGRAWWYGIPNEVFKQQHIYTIFGIDSHTQINPKNLVTQVEVVPLVYDIHEINSFHRQQREEDRVLVDSVIS